MEPTEPTVRSDEREEGEGHREGFRPGDMVGRYVIREVAGSGGQGTVYVAWDPDLDRKVVVKLVRPEADPTAHRARLVREAQAQARLSHPNVITVLDVGMARDQVFVTMVYVDGVTLGQWQKQESPDWRRIVEAYTQAGRGLAASHRAGLVHRDFKPANVLVDGSGRVRVTDFGLAESLDEHDPDAAGEGTPRYMAPEQHRGEATDQRTDQFSFCVGLYEALYGEHPFVSEGADAAELAAAAEEGQVRDPPRGSDVPAWLRRHLLRGLSRDRADRFPSMDALLASLGRDPGVVRRRWAVAAVAVLAFGALGYLAFVRERGATPQDPCANLGDKARAVWNDARKQRVQAALTSTGLAFAADTWTRFESTVTARVDAWTAARTDACRATHVRKEQSERRLDLRMQCLDGRLAEIDALVGQAEGVDANSAAKLAPAALSLAPIGECSDPKILEARFAPPKTAADREAVDSLRAELAKASATGYEGRFEKQLRSVAERADALGYRPLQAEARYLLGRALERNGKNEAARDQLDKSVLAATAAGHATAELDARSALLFMTAFHLSSAKDAARHERHAAALLERVGKGTVHEVRFLLSAGVASSEQGNRRKAAERFEAAVKLSETLLPEGHPLRGLALNYAAVSARRSGDPARANAINRRVLEQTERAFGGRHPNVARALVGLARGLLDMGKLDAAGPLLDRALAVRESPGVANARDIAETLDVQARHQFSKGKLDTALERLTRSLDLRRRALGADHPNVASSLNNLGEIQRAKGDLDAALKSYREAHRIWLEKLGPKHPRVANATHNIAAALAELGRHAEAATEARKAAQGFEAALGPEHPVIARSLTVLGAALSAQAKHRQAIKALERASALLEKRARNPLDRARTQFELAKAYVAGGVERARAEQLAAAAAKAAAGGKSKPHRQLGVAIRAWRQKQR